MFNLLTKYKKRKSIQDLIDKHMSWLSICEGNTSFSVGDSNGDRYIFPEDVSEEVIVIMKKHLGEKLETLLNDLEEVKNS